MSIDSDMLRQCELTIELLRIHCFTKIEVTSNEPDKASVASTLLEQLPLLIDEVRKDFSGEFSYVSGLGSDNGAIQVAVTVTVMK